MDHPRGHAVHHTALGLILAKMACSLKRAPGDVLFRPSIFTARFDYAGLGPWGKPEKAREWRAKLAAPSSGAGRKP
jgi:hypothetical protein